MGKLPGKGWHHAYWKLWNHPKRCTECTTLLKHLSLLKHERCTAPLPSRFLTLYDLLSLFLLYPFSQSLSLFTLLLSLLFVWPCFLSFFLCAYHFYVRFFRFLQPYSLSLRFSLSLSLSYSSFSFFGSHASWEPSFSRKIPATAVQVCLEVKDIFCFFLNRSSLQEIFTDEKHTY